jgi:hypothetical protein
MVDSLETSETCSEYNTKLFKKEKKHHVRTCIQKTVEIDRQVKQARNGVIYSAYRSLVPEELTEPQKVLLKYGK